MNDFKLGIYLDPDFVKSKEDVKKLVNDLKTLEKVDFVLILTKSSDGTAYPSQYTKNVCVKNPQMYSEIVKALKDLGIETHAWFCLYIESVEKPSEIVKSNPGVLLVNKYGKSNLEEPTWSYIKPEYSIYWVCPSAELYREYLKKLMIEVIEKYDVDGIHLDYVRYPETLEGRYYCYCKRCLKRFKEEYGYIFPTNDVIHVRYYVTILCENVSSSVKEFAKLAKEHGKKISAYVFTDYTTAIEACYQDWPYFSRYLDLLLPTLYEVSPEWMKVLVKRAKSVASKGCKITPVIYTNTVIRRAVKGARRWSLKRNAEYILESMRSVKEAGADGIVFYHYSALFGKSVAGNLPKHELERVIEGLRTFPY